MSDAISMAYSRMAEQAGAPHSGIGFTDWKRTACFNTREIVFTISIRCGCIPTWIGAFSDLDPEECGLSRPESTSTNSLTLRAARAMSSDSSGTCHLILISMPSGTSFERSFHFRDRSGLKFRIIGACPPSIQREFLLRHRNVEVTGWYRGWPMPWRECFAESAPSAEALEYKTRS